MCTIAFVNAIDRKGLIVNAKQYVVHLKDRLVDAGLNLELTEESETKIKYVLSTKSKSVWDDEERFFLTAYKGNVSKRWNKFFSYSRFSISDRCYKSKLTYVQINQLIHYAIKKNQVL